MDIIKCQNELVLGLCGVFLQAAVYIFVEVQDNQKRNLNSQNETKT